MTADLSMMSLMVESNLGKGGAQQKRKITMNERDEFRGASLLKRKKTIIEPAAKPVTFDDFEMLMVLGRGAFGKVFLAKLNHN